MELIIRGVSKAFGEKKVLRDVNLTVEEGELVAVMGPSGEGKTTLLRLLMGLEKPDSGELLGLDGKKIAPVFQEDRLIEAMDAVSNIRLVTPELSREDVRNAMERVGLTHCEGQPVRELSGGMRRRVALLRALLCRGELLMLDEPFEGLDADTKAQAIAETLRQRKGRPLLLVTHSEAEAAALNARIWTL